MRTRSVEAAWPSREEPVGRVLRQAMRLVACLVYSQSRFLKMTYRLVQTTAISRIAKG